MRSANASVAPPIYTLIFVLSVLHTHPAHSFCTLDSPLVHVDLKTYSHWLSIFMPRAEKDKEVKLARLSKEDDIVAYLTMFELQLTR